MHSLYYTMKGNLLITPTKYKLAEKITSQTFFSMIKSI